MAYKLTNHNSVIRLSDNAFIPVSEDSRDYKEYLLWVADGNTAEAADLPFEDTWPGARAKRQQFLSATDWTQLSDVALSTPQKTAYAAYRTELREIPQTYANVSDIVWPTEPE